MRTIESEREKEMNTKSIKRHNMFCIKENREKKIDVNDGVDDEKGRSKIFYSLFVKSFYK